MRRRESRALVEVRVGPADLNGADELRVRTRGRAEAAIPGGLRHEWLGLRLEAHGIAGAVGVESDDNRAAWVGWLRNQVADHGRIDPRLVAQHDEDARGPGRGGHPGGAAP